ncbi:MAG: hypothetical protein C0391_07345 [Anaerolinea sp.]|nr:hypothetical protein [Anaerolinea sp.]
MRKVGFLLFVFGLLMILIIILPDPVDTLQFRLDGSQLAEQFGLGMGSVSDEDFSEIEVEGEIKVPKAMLTGRKGRIQLTVNLNEGNGIFQQEGQSIQISSRLDMPREFIEPYGQITRSYTGQLPFRFHWNALKSGSGSLIGRLWVYMSYTDNAGEFHEAVLLARELSIPVKTRLSFDLPLAKQLGIGSAVMTILLFLLDIFIKKKHE